MACRYCGEMEAADRYAIAATSSNLKSGPDTDMLGAGAFISKRIRFADTPEARPGSPLAVALLRLCTGDRRAADELISILTAMMVGKAYRQGSEIGHPAASIIARLVIDWFRDPACKPCGGLGFRIIKHTPTLGAKLCKVCDGARKRDFEGMFQRERVHLARWALVELEREMSLAGPAAMAALAPKLSVKESA